jgi:hypothetical protein
MIVVANAMKAIAWMLCCTDVDAGYFLYDVWDMLRHQPSRQSFELIAHHLPVSYQAINYSINRLVNQFVTLKLHS